MTATATAPVSLARPRRPNVTPLWDALWAERGPALASAALAAIEAQAAVQIAMGGTP